MGKLKNKKWLPVLMGLTILIIAGFQVYWLKKSFQREERTLEIRTNMMFRDAVRSIQATKLKLDRFTIATTANTSANDGNRKRRGNRRMNQRMIGMMDVLMSKANDSTTHRVIIRRSDSLHIVQENISPRQSRIMQFLFDVDSLQDSIKVKEIAAQMEQRLKEQNLDVEFAVFRVPTRETEPPAFNEVTLGFKAPITFRLELLNTYTHILQRLTAPILFSVFLVGFTLLSFTVLYRNLMRQRRLADIKNEFISNITHELKTPIATVSVAIEALRSFGANIDPARTKEYLDISSNELQRLSLLVDKVLKLSMFEKKEIELQYEHLDMKALVDEVNASLRLQFEKKNAKVVVTSSGETTLEGDRLHLVSVLFNLMDNALKYSNTNPEIDIEIKEEDEFIILTIADGGIGIPSEYHDRIFEKFFRVPTGNLHNAKGYGLGLSYVAHVIDKHNGDIKLQSSEEKGTKFTITLPKEQR